jgi:RimJ/RimL family protein N-acetyltransferase
MKLFRSESILKDGQKLIVRIPEIGEEQGLISLMQAVDSETKFLAREPGEFDFTLEQEREFIRNNMNDENSLFLIAEVNGRIIANCHVGLVSNKKRFLHRAAMGIAVGKEFWNRGIGNELMRECIKWCEDKGVEQLELEVVTLNKRALSMYQNLGFEIQGTRKHALKYADGSYADEYFMCLFLNGIKSE